MLFSSIFFILLSLLYGCASIATLPPSDHLKSHQILRVYPKEIPKAQIVLWENHNGRWVNVFGTLEAVIGRNGVAKLGQKLEGDGKTPAGVFDLPYAFGQELSINSRIDYHRVDRSDFWVDDPESEYYNQWVKGKVDAKSFETMYREDGLYRMALVIAYNMNPVIKGKGSAIFMHIWRNYHHGTAGCVAISQRHLRKLLKRLDKAKQPIIEILE